MTESVTEDTTKPNMTINIDDKLDFKNKSRRYEDSVKISTRHNYKNPPKQYGSDYDDDDENVQSVQSVVINNVPHKRPYNNHHHNHNHNHNQKRPVITVTENIDKYTYLINYVPRPTESWRHTTRRNYDRDVVKVTYQTYDDTYRRPNKPYYQNDQTNPNYEYYRNRPDTYIDNESLHSSARSNDDTVTTNKPKTTIDKTDNVNPTTENYYKLVTFGYVGTYKGSDMTDDKVTKPDKTDKEAKHDTISKDFSTYDAKNSDTNDDQMNTMKLSTFFHYETATKPYVNIQRPTRRNDDDLDSNNFSPNTKYYYVKNVLHKYPDLTKTDKAVDEEKRDEMKHIYNSEVPVENIEERSSADKLAFLDEIEKSANPGRLRIKVKKPTNAAKTPSVAFQVIPSENK